MNRRQRVSVSELSRRGNSWRVRWRVDGRQHQRTLGSKAAADRFRRTLLDAIDCGARFDIGMGTPSGLTTSDSMPTIADWARIWFTQRWADRSPKTRASYADLLATVIPLTLLRRAPDDADVRGYIYRSICRRPDTSEPEPQTVGELRGGQHVRRWSPPLDEFGQDEAARLWSALGVLIDGTRAAATTTTRRRTLATKLFDDAVRTGHIETNPLRVTRPGFVGGSLGGWAVRAWSASGGWRPGTCMDLVHAVGHLSYGRAAVAGFAGHAPASDSVRLDALAHQRPELAPAIRFALAA